ncbi:hypothetical protein TYRP_015084 [Tyrophagus putrescentiae]|nr:hypothetical protein TYRP_015084 [Tyrophagus putrescentiae]
MTSTVSTCDPIEELVLRWSMDKITRFAFEHNWTIGKFPVLEQFSSKKSEEEMLSPEFKVEGHDLKFQMKLRYAGMQAEDDKMNLDGAYIKPTNFLLRQMELLKNGSHSDFTVVVGNESIPVHKVLLAAGSPVFAGMFRHEGTKEVKEKKVVIPDVRAEVVKDMLQFLYTGLKPKQSCLTAELLKLADQYLIEELKQHCEQHLSTSLSVLSVVNRFQVAFRHNAPKLKNSCLKFMADHYFEHLSTTMASDPSEELAKRWPHNKVTTFTIEHDWMVGPFPGLPELLATGKNNWKVIKSAVFVPVGGGHNLGFQMALKFDRARDNKEKVFFTLYCYPGTEIASEVPVFFELAFDDGVDEFSYTLSHNFTGEDFLFLEIFTDFTFGDRTTLHQIEKLTASIKLSGAYIKATSFFLSQMELLNSGTLSDFTVVVGDGDKEEQQQIPVHRERLAACSPVFAAMFRHEDTKEAQEKKVMIPDVRADVFKDFLQFVYTGVRPKCGRLTTELLTLADKYQVEELKENCEEYLSATLSAPTVIPRLKVAALHSAAALKESCLAFIAAHFVSVVNTSSWVNLCISGGGGGDGQLVVEATQAMAKSIQASEAEQKKK